MRRRSVSGGSAAVLVLAGALTAGTGALTGGAACGGSTCPDDEPAACPSPMPSFSGEVQAIFQSKCGACHAPGGIKADVPLVTYAEISPLARRRSVLSRVVTCNMPQAGAPPLSDEERRALLGWLVCQGPNN